MTAEKARRHASVLAAAIFGGFAVGHYTTSRGASPTPAIGTAVSHYPTCVTFTPGHHVTPGPCVGKP